MGFFGNFMQKFKSTGVSAPAGGTSEVDDREIPNNPSGRDFLDAARSSIRKTIDKYSIVQNSLSLGTTGKGSTYGERISTPFGSAGIINPGSEVDPTFESSSLGLALPVDTNKVQRIQSYDNIARYPELDWCIGEIANDFIHEDIDGEFMNLKFKCDEGKYSQGADKVIQEEFRHLVSNFDIRSNGYNMIRKFLIEGELCFENVIDPNHPEYGIIGAKYVPNIYYDFLKDARTGQICGLFIDPERIKVMAQYGGYGGASNSYTGQSTTVFNAVRQYPAYSYTYSVGMKNKIIMPWEQVTYMNSGVLSEDGSVVFPAIERVVVPVRQLLLMHDAMVILRITRAPERLVFNLDMTGLQPKEAKKEVRKFMEQRRSKKAVVGSGAVTNVYNAETMLDAYYFWKTSEASGAQVTSLNSTAHYNELHDVEYFLHRILKFLNIPWARWQESSANRQDRNSIVNEEYSFAQMIVRMQQLFSSAVKKTFITHLRLRGLFDKFDVNESDFDVIMVAPAIFELYQAQQRFNDGLDIMSKLAGLDFMSKNLILKKVFCWTDSEIKENEVNVRREALYKAQTDFMAQSVGQAGTPTAGKLWLDPEKYVNPPPTNPTGTDVNGGAPMPPPDGGGAPGGAPMPPPPPQGGEMQPPPDMGGMPTGGAGEPQGIPPEAGGAPVGGGVQPLDMTEPKIPEVDDSGTSKAEKELKTNPEFGDFESKERGKSPDFMNHYPETEDGLEGLETGRGVTLKSIFDRTLGDELDSKKSLEEIFGEEFGKSEKKFKGRSLKSVFDDSFGDEDDNEENEKPSEGKTLTSVFKDVFIRKIPMKDHFKDAFKK